MWQNKINFIGFVLLSMTFVSCGSETSATHVDAGADSDVESVVYCEENFHVYNGNCVSCDSGMIREEGDFPEEGNTFCEPDACNVALGLSCDEFYQAYIKSSNSEKGDQFGFSIALHGDTLAVGAPHEDSEAAGINGDQDNNDFISSGAVYIFTRSGSIWTQQAYIKASNSDVVDCFGYSVALDGDTLAVGAPYEDSSSTGINNDQNDNMSEYSGAVYIFTRSDSTWTQQAYIKASNSETYDGFGFSVDLNNETLVVGAPYEDSSSTGVNSIPNNDFLNIPWNGAGAVYVFVRSDSEWTQQAYIKSFNPQSQDLFGYSVVIENDLIIVGSPSENNSERGIIYDPYEIEGNTLSINSGAIHTFTRFDTEWRQDAYVKASNSFYQIHFGHSIDVYSNEFIVGAPGESNALSEDYETEGFLSDSGAAYLFTSESEWIETRIKPSGLYEDNEFGRSVAIYGDRIAISAPYRAEQSLLENYNSARDRNFDGDIFLYSRSEDEELGWSHQMVIDSPFPKGVYFGYRLELYEDTLVTGMPYEDSSTIGINGDQEDRLSAQSGAVYVMILE